MRRSATIWLLFILLANALVVSGCGGADVASSGAYGRATSRATTLIYNVHDLQNMSNDLKGTYELANDIDASDTVNWNGGAGFEPIGNGDYPFNGIFDGKGFNIMGLFINRPGTDYVGLFGFVGIVGNGGKNNLVKNIGVININVTGKYCVGGLVGFNCGMVIKSYASGNVTGLDNCIGGLVGCIYADGTMDNSYAAGNVTGRYDVGGLVGSIYDDVTVNNSYATGNVTSMVCGFIGGLVGDNGGEVNNSFAMGNVKGDTYVGGLVGYVENCGKVDNSYAAGNVTGRYDVGGLVGSILLSGTVNNSYATGNVTGTGDQAGGFVGYNGGEVNNSFATGNVKGDIYVGGLAGYIEDCGTVDNSYAAGNVTGRIDVGGLVGYVENCGKVNNSYATGYVTGTGDQVGGFVGYNGGEVNNSYSTGYVTGIGSVGGLVATNEGTVSNCFWDDETSGQSSSAGGTGETTAEMKTLSTFTDAGWDFANIWCMVENITYPVFKWQLETPPTANAGPDQTVYERTLVTFDGGSSTDGVAITNYTWAFNDGAGNTTLHGVAPSHTFNVSGVYSVVLNISDGFGRWDTDALTVTVRKYPVADAGPDQTVDLGVLVSFNGSGSTAGAGIINYSWTFNDGTGDIILYDAAPSHTFNVPGVYAVTLNITDTRGDWAIDMMNVTVKDVTPPAADAGADRVIDQGSLMTFDGSGSRDNIGIVNYSWKFIDGAPVTLYGVRPAYHFDNPGIFIVTLTATDAAGNRATDTMTVTVIDTMPPVANAGSDRDIDQGTLLTFDGSASNDNVGITTYTWTFIDGTLVTLHGADPRYVFKNVGIFVITLNVTDAAGNWNTDTITVTVKDMTPPVAYAGPDRTVDEGATVTFNGSGSSDNVGIVNYSWSFDCGTQKIVLYGVSPSFTFDVPGVYSVTLNVTDAAGFRAEDVMTLTVKDITPPVANAGRDQRVLVGSTVVLNGSLSTDNLAISKFYWNFTYDGKAQSLEGKKVSFKFDKAGVYVVVLTVVDGAGNRGEDRIVITVEPTVNVLQGLLWMPVLLMAVAGIATYVVMRKRRARKGWPSQFREEPAK